MIEKFVEFKPRDVETVKNYESIFNNVGRLLSKIFTLTITEVKFALQKGQDWPPYRGWIFKFKDFNCWYGVSLSSQSFLSLRFHVKLEEGKESILLALKEQGFQKFSWPDGGGEWLWREKPSNILKVSDKDQQIRICIDILKDNLFAIEGVL